MFEAPEPSVGFVGSVMRISTLATFIVRKNTMSWNFVSESEMLISVGVKKPYPLIALPICIDKIHGYTDLCVYLDYIFKIKASLHQETCPLQHGVSQTMILIIDFSKFELSTKHLFSSKFDKSS